MDDLRTNGAAVEDAPPPRTYFDGDESRYQGAQAQAVAGESTLLRWKRALEYLVWLLGVACVVLLGTVLWLATRSTVRVEFVVQNAFGQWRLIGWDDYHPMDGELKKALEEWLHCVRSIPTDRQVYTRCWRRVPMFIKAKSQCAQEVTKYAEQRKPEQHLYQKSVVVKELIGGREPDGRWRFSWTEDTYQLDHGHTGPLVDTSQWHATLITTRQPPTTPEQIRDGSETVNPQGLLCTELAWWK